LYLKLLHAGKSVTCPSLPGALEDTLLPGIRLFLRMKVNRMAGKGSHRFPFINKLKLKKLKPAGDRSGTNGVRTIDKLGIMATRFALFLRLNYLKQQSTTNNKQSTILK
jgi:hypothetical protein